MNPDWVYDTATGAFTGRCLRRRPPIEVEIRETGWEWWPYFEPHHYLNSIHLGLFGATDRPLAIN